MYNSPCAREDARAGGGGRGRHVGCLVHNRLPLSSGAWPSTGPSPGVACDVAALRLLARPGCRAAQPSLTRGAGTGMRWSRRASCCGSTGCAPLRARVAPPPSPSSTSAVRTAPWLSSTRSGCGPWPAGARTTCGWCSWRTARHASPQPSPAPAPRASRPPQLRNLLVTVGEEDASAPLGSTTVKARGARVRAGSTLTPPPAQVWDAARLTLDEREAGPPPPILRSVRLFGPRFGESTARPLPPRPRNPHSPPAALLSRSRGRRSDRAPVRPGLRGRLRAPHRAGCAPLPTARPPHPPQRATGGPRAAFSSRPRAAQCWA